MLFVESVENLRVVPFLTHLLDLIIVEGVEEVAGDTDNTLYVPPCEFIVLRHLYSLLRVDI